MAITDVLNPFKWVSAGKEAIKKTAEVKNAKWYEKVGIFFSAFFEEMGKVEAEEKKTSGEADENAAAKIDVSMKGFQDAMKLLESVTGTDRELFEKVGAMAVASCGQLDATNRASAQAGLEKLDKATKDEKPEMEYKEGTAVLAVGLMTFKQLKAKFGTETALADALKKFAEISEQSSYPLRKVLASLSVFKMGDMDGLKLLTALGVQSDFVEVGGLLKEIGKSPMGREAELVQFMGERVFPNTSKEKVGIVVEALNRLVIGNFKTDETKESLLAKLIMTIEDNDYDRLVKVLTGKSTSSAEKLGS